MSLPPTGAEESDQEPGSVDISLLDLQQLLDLFIMLLSEQAMRYLGLRADPRAKKDLVKAHLAIDCVVVLVDKLEPTLSGEAKDRFRNLITDLQLKYVQQMK